MSVLYYYLTISFILITGLTMPIASQNKLTLEDIFSSEKFKGSTISNIHWLPNSSGFLYTREHPGESSFTIFYFDLEKKTEKKLLEPGELLWNGKPVVITGFQTTGDNDFLLLRGPQKHIWRHSYSAPYYLFQMSTRKLLPLAKGDPELQNVTLSPNGKWVAYVKHNNLFVAEVSNEESTQLTFDGSFNILNGVFDWVYEEEFGRADAFHWSPDSRYIAFWRTDQTRVKTFTLLDEMPHYSVPIPLKYPKVGEQNAIVKIGVVNINTRETQWIDIGSNDDIYIPRVQWTTEPNLLSLQRLNRKQNHWQLLLSNLSSGETRVVVEDKNQTWIDITDDLTFVPGTSQFVWSSERSGYRHLYLTDYQSGETRALTQGEWEISSLLGIDTNHQWVYFYGKKDSPLEQHIYRVSLNGKKFQKISDTPGWHQAVFSPNFQYYVSFDSDVKTPTRIALRKASGKLIHQLEENQIPALKNYRMVYPEFLTFKTSDGVTLNAYMMKPADFDPAKKYPVIVYGYGGPGSQMVLNRWGMGSRFRHVQRVLWHQYMTEQGYIVFCVDNRGTGGRGKAFKDVAYGDLSQWAVHDQVEGARYLSRLPYVDSNRIGFWGWSGGGYLTCMMLLRAPDVFKTGVAVASVTDFRNYDTIWTERYMGLLTDNQEGYEKANVLNYADGLKGHLLMIHGTGDDNVHPQNTLQLANKFITLNKQFDLMLYPNRNHRIHGGNTQLHLFTLISNYFMENL